MLTDRNISNVKCVPCRKYVSVFGKQRQSCSSRASIKSGKYIHLYSP